MFASSQTIVGSNELLLKVLAYDLRTRQQVMSIVLPALVTLVQDMYVLPDRSITQEH